MTAAPRSPFIRPLAARLLDWYAANARTLPWRDHPDPYAVWVSEIMLQQTRVETVIPYFRRWMARFPSVFRLAAAPRQEVLALWEGLGYYARARNLHRTAQILVREHGGELPRTAAELAKLPGIGRYTAAAIASIAFGEDVAALDGNIRRVLSRVFNVAEPARSPAGERRLWALAQEHLPAGRAGDYNQALMDLGSLVCTPKSPSCAACPLADLCEARRLNLQEERPLKMPKKTLPHHTVVAAVIRRDGQVFIAQRPADGLLGGLWEFPGGKTEPGETLPEALRRELREELAIDVEVGAPFGVYRHTFTHFKVTLHAFVCRLANGSEPIPREHSDIRWVTPAQLADFPMGKIDRQIAEKLASRAGDSALPK
jgi:A/G-specific adenine glycosylase